MRLRFRLFTACFALAASLLFASSVCAKQNIVFILVDSLDMSVWETALTTKDVYTGLDILPNIKKELIDRGTTFDQMFVTQSLCCPSRTTLQTGQYPQNHNVVGNHDVYAQFKAGQEKLALGLWMKNAGYRTGYFGKYMNESGLEDGYVPPGWETWRALSPPGNAQSLSSTQCMYGYSLANNTGSREFFDGAPNTSPTQYQTDKLAELSSDFIGSSDSRPFLLVVAPMAPHTENCNGIYKDPSAESRVRTAPRYLADPAAGRPKDSTPYVELPASKAASYDEAKISDKPLWMQDLRRTGDLTRRTKLFNDKLAAMRPVDDLVQKVVGKLRKIGKYENTVIVFTSDNGFQYGTHRLSSKEDFYEESIRVPMVVRVPGTRKVANSPEWVLNNDWAVTIADYAQATPLLTVDGRSFKWILDGAPSPLPSRKTFLVRSGPNPLPGAQMSGLHVPDDDDGNEDHVPFLAVRTRDTALTGDQTGATVYVYAETYQKDGVASNHEKELYNLKDDLPQMKSAHLLDTTRVDVLQPRLQALKNCAGAVCRSLEN